jgi:hypothetical protein
MKSLGMKMSGGPVPCPCESTSDDVYYPSLYIDSDEPLHLPDAGEVTIQFKLRRKSVEKTDDGKAKCCYTLDVIAIGEATAEPKRKKDRHAEIDDLFAEMASENKESY